MNSADSVVIAGSIAQRPFIGGHTWQFLQYLLGFRRLGWRVLLIDRLEPGMCRDEAGDLCPPEASVNLRYSRQVMDDFGLSDQYSLLYEGEVLDGVARPEIEAQLRESAFLLNVMGFLTDPDLLASARLRVFLDTDPGYAQMWQDLGLATMLHSHDRYVTIAERIGAPGCGIPSCGIDWIRWRQPVVLEQWPFVAPQPAAPFTAIGAWRGPYAPLEYRGHSYGQRVHEFRKFLCLPGLTGAKFDLAADIDPSDQKDIDALRANGWNLIPPEQVSATPQDYRAFIQASRAEVMVSRGMYVDTKCGWFSERSACYLATGRPVLAQDTGLHGALPVGDGLLTFTTPDEAVEGIRDIQARYEHHSRNARELAESAFDSDAALLSLATRVTASPALRGRSD